MVGERVKMLYQLESVAPKRSAIYQQIYQYYYFCEHVRHMSQVTLTNKIYVVNGFIRGLSISDLRKLDNQMVYDWITQQRLRGNTGRSVNDRLAHIKAMLRWQQDMNILMPKLRLALIAKVNEEPPRKVYFTRDDIKKVLKTANELEWLLISLAFDCGLRISELQKLQPKHLSNDRLTIIGKGAKQRYVYLCAEVLAKLQHWIKSRNITIYFWPSPLVPNQPLSICTLRSHMKQAFARRGFSDFCPHDLRHSYATDLKSLGIPTRQIQAGLGHATEAVTEKYLSDLDGFDLRQIYQIKYSVK